MDEIVNSLIKIATLLLFLFASRLAKRVENYLKAKLDEKDAAKLDQLIDELTAAAEQLLKKEPGEKRLAYVQGMLLSEGYELTETIRAKIESRVFNININQQGAETP